MEVNSSQPIPDYYDKRLTVFSCYLEKTKQDFGVEDLHKLRVEIKKLRAWYRFLEDSPVVDFKKKKHFQLLAKIFKPGGFLRETQMNQSIIRRYRSYELPGYNDYLQRLNSKQSKKFRKSLGRFDHETFNQNNSLLHAKLVLLDLTTVKNNAYAFINRELEVIRELRQKIENDKDLHQVRTHTKAMGYIAKFINELCPSDQVGSLLASAKKAEKLIGNWHDRVVLANSLRRFLKKNPKSPEHQKITKLTKQIDNRNRQVVNTIAHRLDGFIFISR